MSYKYNIYQILDDENPQNFLIQENKNPEIVYDTITGKVIKEIWRKDGKKHKNDGPAEILYDSDERIASKKWYLNDILQKEENYCYLFQKRFENLYFYKKGYIPLKEGSDGDIYGIHKIFTLSGTLIQKLYSRNGSSHRSIFEGPAVTFYSLDGKIQSEMYIENRKVYYEVEEDETISFIKGYCYNLNGPCYIKYDEKGNVIKKDYALIRIPQTRENYYRVRNTFIKIIDRIKKKNRKKLLQEILESKLTIKIDLHVCDSIVKFIL